MAAKLQIASSTHSKDELAVILSDYTSVPIVHCQQLFGGYSGSSYSVELQDGTRHVVKISNGYSAADAEFMCRTAHHLATVGYRDCSLPIPKQYGGDGDGKYEFVSLKELSGAPAFLLEHVPGQQADRVMRDSPGLAAAVMRGIGGGLGRMHGATVGVGRDTATERGLRWYEKDGGCCDVQDQIDGKVLAKILDSDVRDHDFVPFYERELEALREEMRLSGDGTFATGITHGDPFADNVLVDPVTGELSSFIDIEDVCVGSLLFDLACCAIGCCFKGADESVASVHPQVLDLDLLGALLEGYASGRALPDEERRHFVPYMRLTLLCNCCWRFVKFNIDAAADVPEEAKNSFLELQRRIDYLHEPAVVESISVILGT